MSRAHIHDDNIRPTTEWGDMPVPRARSRVRAGWTQQGAGTCDVAPRIIAAGATPYISTLKELQGILGELNDIAVARRLVGARADETELLRRLDAAWKRFARRSPFWRAAG